ncbi:MAG TPA: hypothetical protein VHO91_12970 [Rhodopila sp.]|nr:hypothetical protein [Rhodopila sp.]
MHDDIPELESGSESEQVGQTAPKPGPGTVGPESETRGGPEAPDEALDEQPPLAGRRPGQGHRAALPEGTLPGPYFGTQGDENRQPPANAPAPVNPTATVGDGRPDSRRT